MFLCLSLALEERGGDSSAAAEETDFFVTSPVRMAEDGVHRFKYTIVYYKGGTHSSAGPTILGGLYYYKGGTHSSAGPTILGGF